MLWISEQDAIAAGVLDMERARKAVEETFLTYHKGGAVNASEVPVIHPDFGSGRFYSLPAYDGNVAGLKWTTLFPENTIGGIPSSCTLLLLGDPKTGQPLAVIDGRLISSMRTGAVTATALKYLKKGNEKTALCCGAGVQARQQIRAICTVMKEIQTIYIWGRTKEKAMRLADDLAVEYPGIAFEAVGHFTEVVRKCDIVIAATPAADPYLKKEHFKESCLYCHIGMDEIEAEAIDQFDAIICDEFEKGIATSRQSLFAAARAHTLRQERLQGDLAEYLAGDRTADKWKNGRIMFDAFGLPVFDVALGAAVYSYAMTHGIGLELR